MMSKLPMIRLVLFPLGLRVGSIRVVIKFVIMMIVLFMGLIVFVVGVIDRFTLLVIVRILVAGWQLVMLIVLEIAFLTVGLMMVMLVRVVTMAVMWFYWANSMIF